MSKLKMCKNCNSYRLNKDGNKIHDYNLRDTALICKYTWKPVDSVFICHNYSEK